MLSCSVQEESRFETGNRGRHRKRRDRWRNTRPNGCKVWRSDLGCTSISRPQCRVVDFSTHSCRYCCWSHDATVEELQKTTKARWMTIPRVFLGLAGMALLTACYHGSPPRGIGAPAPN